MRLCKSLLLFLMISLGCQISAAEYNVKKFIEDIDSFIPIPGDMISKGLKAYESFNEILDTLNGVPTEASVNQQLKDIKDDIKKSLDQGYKTEEKIDRLKELIPQQVQIDSQIRDTFLKILKIDKAFDDFVRDVLHYRLENVTLDNMAIRFVVGTSSERIELQLADIDAQLDNNKTSVALLNLLQDKKQTNEMMCASKQSPMHLLNVLLNDIIKAEMKGIVIAMWSYNHLRNETIRYEGEKDRYIDKAKDRIISVSRKIKNAMKSVGHDFWLCDPYPKAKGINYESFDPFISIQIFPETDAAELTKHNERIRFGDTSSCEELGKKDNIEDLCESDFCAKDNVNGRCMGFMRNCYLHEKGSEINVCLANPKKYSGIRKYMSMKIDNEVYGTSNECHKNITLEKFDFLKEWSASKKSSFLPELKEDISFLDVFQWVTFSVEAASKPILIPLAYVPIYKKDNCICTCDDTVSVNVRFVSLDSVYASITRQHNRVITGARIVRDKVIIKIQIQVATLLKNGNIGKDLQWLPHTYPTQDIYAAYKVSLDNRQVNIDHSLNAPHGSALTGLRFENEDGHLKLAIQYTPFDFESGKLNFFASEWVSKPNNLKDSDNSPKRRELEFNTALPTDSDHTLDSTDNAFLKFTTSSLKTDVGQTVVPFFDTQSLTSNPATLLSGAGLVYRSSPISAGFLALKLQTYDFEPHLVV